MSDSVSGKKHFESSREGLHEKKAKCFASCDGESARNKSVANIPVSEGNLTYICNGCSNMGSHVEAQGFCIECEEYLCGTCFASHSRDKLSKHHSLLDNAAMPRHCGPCYTVGDKADAIVYCKDCKEYLCSTCHRSHLRNKLSRHHALEERDKVSKVASAITKIAIKKDDPSDKEFKEKYTFTRDINIKSETDKTDCFITDMVLLSDNELILCDNGNRALKFVDIERGILVKKSQLTVNPRGIAIISKDKLAVVTTDSSILIVSTLGKCKLLRTWNKRGDCVNVEFINEKLYVSFQQSFQNVKFQIIMPTGVKLKTIKPAMDVSLLCRYPRHIAVSPDESVIYVSDCDTNHVISVDLDGNLKHSLQYELDLPRDIKISPFGSVYLCNTKQHTVIKMTPDLRKATQMLGPEQGLFLPQTMCFNTHKQHLYISSGISKSRLANTSEKFANCIKVFKWE